MLLELTINPIGWTQNCSIESLLCSVGVLQRWKLMGAWGKNAPKFNITMQNNLAKTIMAVTISEM